MAALGPLVGENLGVERAPDRGPGGRPAAFGSNRRCGRLRDRGRRPVRIRLRRAGEAVRRVPSGRSRADGGSRHPLEDRRLRDQLRRRCGLLAFGVLLGGMSIVGRGCAGVGRGNLGRRLRARPVRSGAGRHARTARAGAGSARAGRSRLVVDRRSDGRDGRGSRHRSGRARLVPRRVGGDDGGDDVPVAGADGGALRAHDPPAGPRPPAAVRRQLPARVGRGRAGRPTACSRSGGSVPAVPWPGMPVADGWPAASLAFAAVYELTPLKNVCLAKCRSPLGLLLGHWRDGRPARSRWGPGTPAGAWAAAGG